MNKISKRKKEHIEICVNENPTFTSKTNGFEMYDFIHNALPEIDYDEIGLSTKFYDKKIDFPFLISCMTGGTKEANNLNSQLAEVAAELNIPIGVGSQREVLEENSNLKSYTIIRENAKNVPVLSNIGGQQLLELTDLKQVLKIIDVIEADVLVIHLNPLQELLQKEGDRNFKGVLEKIAEVSKIIDIPVMVKEVGFGINKEVAERLLESGVKGIDVAGAGGTSWSAVELIRDKKKNSYFWNWGMPTSYCIKDVSQLKQEYKFVLIGSGGINNGVDIAKALALGSDIAASARPVLISIHQNGIRSTINLLLEWFEEVKKILLLTGSNTVEELDSKCLIKKTEFY